MNVLISGVSSGIGKEVSRYLIQNGINVYGIDIKDNDLEGINFYKCDIRSTSTLKEISESLKDIKFDAIINFAGILILDNFIEISDEDLSEIIDINVIGVINFNKIFFPLLKERGKILITTSEVGPVSPLPFNSIYSMTKASLENYAKGLRKEINILGYKVVVLRPGAVKTPMESSSIPSMEAMLDKTKYYKKEASRFKGAMLKFTGKPMDPIIIAKKVYKILNKSNPRLAYSIHNNFLLKLLSILPERLQMYIVKKIVN